MEWAMTWSERVELMVDAAVHRVLQAAAINIDQLVISFQRYFALTVRSILETSSKMPSKTVVLPECRLEDPQVPNDV